MAQEIKGFKEHFSGFKRNWKLAVATFLVIFGAGVSFTMSLKDVYRSTGFILIEEAEIPEEIIRSTVTTYTTRQVTELTERILTVTNLVRLIEEYDLYPEQRQSQPTELLALNAREAISVEVQSRETYTESGLPRPIAVGFTVSFDDESPQKAQAVAEELVGLYLDENVKVRAEQTSQTSNFLKGEVARLEEEIGVLESGLARFKEQNADKLPSLNAVNLQQITRIDGQILDLDRRIAGVRENRIGIQAQMTTVSPNLASRLADGSIVLSPADQLKSLQTQLSVYQSRYSDDHPDVIRTQRDIASIKERFGLDVDLADLETALLNARTDLAVAQERYTSDHPDVIRLEKSIDDLERQVSVTTRKQLDSNLDPDNPAYIALQSQLNTLDIEEAAFEKERKELQVRMDRYEASLMASPQIEKELAAMTRQLSSTANRYWVMRDKQFSAELGETLETQSKGEEMIVIDPPRVPFQPYKPDRGAILALSFLFALICGIGITQLLDALDGSIRGAGSIRSVQGEAPLVEIPYIYSPLEIERAKRFKRIGFAAAPAVAVVLAVIIHFTLIPLDVLFFAALQRLGL